MQIKVTLLSLLLSYLKHSLASQASVYKLKMSETGAQRLVPLDIFFLEKFSHISCKTQPACSAALLPATGKGRRDEAGDRSVSEAATASI